jgi:hypothetical protein
MATRTLTRLFDNHEDALATVRALEEAGFTRDQISLVAHSTGARHFSDNETNTAGDGAGAGATAGTIIGGGLGLLAGIGSLAIPGVGPVVAAGWLVATLTGAGAGAAVGAGAGGLIGSLTSAGVPEDQAHVYAEGVRRGGSLVNVRVDDDHAEAESAERILNSRGYVDPDMRRAEYQRTGWTHFDQSGTAYDAPALDAVGENRRTGTTL